MQARHRQPLDLAYIAAMLRSDFEVSLVDASVEGMDVLPMVEIVRSFGPDVLITTTTPVNRWECPQSYIDSFYQWIAQVGALPKKPITIVTGTHGTTQPDWLLGKAPAIDILVRGEPERTTEVLVRTIAAKGSLSAVAGITYRQGKKVLHTATAPRITDLDALPFPAYDLLPMPKYRYTFNDIPQPFSIVLATRGCPYRCTFCCRAMMENAYAVRSPANVYAELKLLQVRFGVRGVFFQDWEFLINKPFVNQLLDLMISNPLGIIWGCNARANDFRTPEIIEKMKAAGCVRLNLGFESGSPEILKSINKMVTVDDLALAVKVTQRLGLKLGMYALLNAPGETTKTIRQTVEFLAQQGIGSMNFNLVVPYFGTQVSRQLMTQLGPEAASRVTWDTVEEYAGKTRVQLWPRFAKLYLRHVKFQLRFGRTYFFNPRFYAFAFRRFR